MKKITKLAAAVLLTFSFGLSTAFAQAPEKMSYQAVIRNAGNALVTNQNVGMQISILQTTATGTAIYVETQTITTNANGLVSLEIGNGTVVSGNFTTIDWSNGPYFIKTETDPTGGSNYTITGTSQLMSVPYALYAKTSGSSNWTKTSNKVYNTTDSIGIRTTTPNNVFEVAGYINFNDVKASTFIGKNVGINNNAFFNVGLGTEALKSITSGASNVATGYSALRSNTTGDRNVAIGDLALYYNTTGNNNIAAGAFALYLNTTGSNNVATGYGALLNNATGSNNIANGDSALYSNTTGFSNVAIGNNSLSSNVNGYYNIAIGELSLENNTSGANNIANGYSALNSNTTGQYNLAFGYESLFFNTIGAGNLAFGYKALKVNLSGNDNIALGGFSLLRNTTGSSNIAIGEEALVLATTGNNNTAIGYKSGDNITTGNNNILLGHDIDAPSATASNQLNIGNLIFATGMDGTGTTLSTGNVGIGVTTPGYKLDVEGDVRLSPASANADFIVSHFGSEPSFLPSLNNYGYIGNNLNRVYEGHYTNLTVYGSFTNTSDRRIKENIQPLNGALNKVLQLSGKTYDLKRSYMFGDGEYDAAKTAVLEASRKNKIGFIAQEIEEVLPQLVKTNASTDLKSVDYIGVIPLLVEAMKEQQQQFETELNELRKEIAALKK